MKSIIRTTGSALLLILFFVITANAQSNIFNLTVKEDRLVTKNGQKYLKVKYSNSTYWEPFYAPIKNFNYQEGYSYQLKVKRTKVQDGLGYTYTLYKTVKKQAINVKNKEKVDQAVTTSPSELVYIEKYEWKLIQLNGKTLAKVNPTLKLDFSENKLAGFAGCNRYFGGFTLAGNKITFSNLGMTMMHCEGEGMKIEQEYSKLLQDASFTFDVADQTLNFYKDNKLVLMFGRLDVKK